MTDPLVGLFGNYSETEVAKVESFPFSTPEQIEVKRSVTKVDLNTDREASSKRLEELKAGRKTDDIPPRDEYHKAVRKHRLAFNRK